MEVTVKIFRYNPEKDQRGNYVTYKIEADPNDRVLDVLEHIKGKTDGALSFRRSLIRQIRIFRPRFYAKSV